MFEWYKKESPLKALAGLGGGVGRGSRSGVILTNDTDPFGDGSCLYTYQFNGTNTKLGGGTGLNGSTGEIKASAAKFGSGGFNGTGASQLNSNSTNLRPSGDFSINFWYRSSGQGQDNKRVLTVKGSQVNMGWNNWNNRFGFYTGTGNEPTTVYRRREIYDATANDGNWHQITGTVTTGNTFKFYFDGVEWTQTSVNQQDSRSFNSGNYLAITTYDGSGTYNTVCNIDQIRVFNRVLTADEVAQLNNEVAP